MDCTIQKNLTPVGFPAKCEALTKDVSTPGTVENEIKMLSIVVWKYFFLSYTIQVQNRIHLKNFKILLIQPLVWSQIVSI